MTPTHTPVRLQVPEPYDGQHAVIVENDCGRYAVAVSIRNPADARRLAACWNACANIPTEALEGSSVTAIARDGGPVRQDDMRRINACVAVCQGFETELLEHIVSLGETMLTRFQARNHADEIIIADRLRFMQERDKLRTALNKLLNTVNQYDDGDYYLGTDAEPIIAEANRVSIETAEPAPPPDTTITTNSVCGKPGTTCGDTIPF